MCDLTKFEKLIIEVILKCEADKTLADLLFKQYNHLYVKKRSYTGVGFYTDFYLSEKGNFINKNLNLKLGGIHAELQGLKYGAGFVLYIESGVIVTLEGYCYNEKWPSQEKIIDIFKVHKSGELTRINL